MAESKFNRLKCIAYYSASIYTNLEFLPTNLLTQSYHYKSQVITKLVTIEK